MPIFKRFHLKYVFKFSDNIQDSFLELGQFIARSKDPEVINSVNKPSYNQVMADITTSFTILIGIFFPSVTGALSVINIYNTVFLPKISRVMSEVFGELLSLPLLEKDIMKKNMKYVVALRRLYLLIFYLKLFMWSSKILFRENFAFFGRHRC